MRYQVCEIVNGELKHYYYSPKMKEARLSKNRATTLTKEEAEQIIHNYPHHDLFIQTEYDCHFRETEKNGLIISQPVIDAAETSERKPLTVHEMIELCCENNWFTSGSNEQCIKLFEMVEAKASFVDLALIIWICSNNVTKEKIMEILEDNFCYV